MTNKQTGRAVRRLTAGMLALQIGITAFGVPAFASKVTIVSPHGVETLSPEGAIQSTGTWDVGTRAGDYVYVAGMRGIDPTTNKLVADEEGRIRQAFLNMKLIAESEGATLQDATRLVVYVTDMYRYRPIVNQIQEELWGKGPYPPRTIVEVDRLNQDDIVEVEGTFYAPEKTSKAAQKGPSANGTNVSPNGVKTLAPQGAIQSTGTWNLGTRAGDNIYVAGMRGIDPATNKLVSDEEGRIRQAFLNMKLIAESEGATLQDATRLVVYVTDMYRYRPIVNRIQEELWGDGPYPPRTIIEVDRLNQDDIVEVEGTFYAPEKTSKAAQKGPSANGTNVSPNGVKTLAPQGAIQTTGTWDLGTRAGDTIYVAGMRGIDPASNNLVSDEEGRIRQAFLNMKLIAESEGATLRDATRIVVYVTDMYRYRPIVNQIQEELWGDGPYPPRTIIEVDRLNQDDIVEVEGTFYAPKK
ncbi:RidA family protein [Paenibacillus sp. JJ-223]|uniref:RidA family protein n=1 Tax=Paenibacillus sp. JJ-223 TaxID=2905647 RepID=UPI001F440B4B|nr:RidA family protein [Paenibacillus sp. JJ-223]CAH1205090.1 Putative aminoacrylate peracid reductase RutC [Paenibacillus sp. JJ-223]